MRFTVQLPMDKVALASEFLSGAAIGEMARAAEDAGFDAAFVTDHPAPDDRWLASAGHHALDPFVALSFAAAATTRLRLQTHVLIAAYRNPFLAAKAIASLDVASGGRTIVGVAAGYLESEFAAFGARYDERNELGIAAAGVLLIIIGAFFTTRAMMRELVVMERKKAASDEMVMQSSKMAALGKMAAGIAHEINNPLGTILLFADMLYKEAAENDPKRDDMKMIINETIRCRKIVADLLNFARQHEVLAQECDVNDILEQVIDGVSHQPSFNSAEIVRRFQPGIPPIQADQAQLMQVFVNLLNNAAEAMPGGGTITISSRLVDSQRIEIKVSDTGCGMSEENLAKLFTPFFTTKAVGKGTGLGLSIVYGIIKMHRGQITVNSQVGQGTTFTVILPIMLSSQQVPHSAPQAELTV